MTGFDLYMLSRAGSDDTRCFVNKERMHAYIKEQDPEQQDTWEYRVRHYPETGTARYIKRHPELNWGRTGSED